MTGRGGHGGQSRGGRGRGGRGGGGRSGNYPRRGEGAIHVVALPSAPVPIATPVATTNSFLHQLLNLQTHAVLQTTALLPTPAAIPPLPATAGLTREGAIEGPSPAASPVTPAEADGLLLSVALRKMGLLLQSIYGSKLLFTLKEPIELG